MVGNTSQSFDFFYGSWKVSFSKPSGDISLVVAVRLQLVGNE
jgi:hypothetical protein